MPLWDSGITLAVCFIKKHMDNYSHCQVLLGIIIGEMLSAQHAIEKAKNRHCLLKIISVMKGCSIRGSSDEVDGNFLNKYDPKVYISKKSFFLNINNFIFLVRGLVTEEKEQLLQS